MGDASIEGIGGVRDTQMWVFFIGEEVGQIINEAPIGCPDPPMGIVPPSGSCISRPFLEKFSPRRMPISQILCKSLFIGLGECRYNDCQFLSSWEKWVSRQIAPHNGHLMEVAHLDRIAWRQSGFDASSAIANNRLNNPACVFKMIDSPKIIRNRLPTNWEPVEIPVQVRCPEEHDAATDTKKEPIDNRPLSKPPPNM